MMFSFRSTLRVAILGLATGALIALASPPKDLQAFEGCKCNDNGTGSYACNFLQTACVPGSETCSLVCGED